MLGGLGGLAAMALEAKQALLLGVGIGIGLEVLRRHLTRQREDKREKGAREESSDASPGRGSGSGGSGDSGGSAVKESTIRLMSRLAIQPRCDQPLAGLSQRAATNCDAACGCWSSAPGGILGGG